jgi:multidrug efflux system membrane fusion protein
VIILLAAPALRGQPATRVKVAQPIVRQVVDHLHFDGRLEPAASVDIRPLVSGTITKVLFQAGAAVKRGDVMFEIDSTLYQAQFTAAEAKLQLEEAALKHARGVLERLMVTFKKQPGAVNPAEIDQAQTTADMATARVRLAQADLATAKIRLDWTHVASPIEGKVDRAFVTPGNLAVADTTLLTTVVASGPMYVTFGVDDGVHFDLQKLLQESKDKDGKPRPMAPLTVHVGKDQELQARLDFVGIRVDPGTGKVPWRAVLADKDANLLPGQAVKVRIAKGEPYKALLVALTALQITGGIDGSESKQFVYVVNAKNVVERREVKARPKHDGMWVVTEGLAADDWVVLLSAKNQFPTPGMAVETEPTVMPLK